MSKIEELIKKHCPDGVEYKTLMEVAKCTKGTQLNKNGLLEDGYPVINGGINPSGYWSEYNFEKNTITISQGGASAGYVNYQLESFWAGAHCYVIVNAIPSMNYKFLYYVIKMNEKKLTECQYGAGIPALASRTVNNLPIPVPPLPVQEEIVRILDNFTTLEAELEARRKQYEYYKWTIFENLSCPTKHITDIALVKARVGWQRLTTAEYLTTGDYYLITGTDFKNGVIDFKSCVYVSKERYEMDSNIIIGKGDILITKDGTLGKVAYIAEEPEKPTTLNSGVFRIHTTESNVSSRYLYHYFTSKYFTDFVESVKTGSTIPHLTQQGLTTLNIPIPSLAEQEKIANILDRFDTLVNDISQGLPAEIAARRKQYEYYRDKLLTFKEKTA